MAFRIASSAKPEPTPARRPQKNTGYLKFIRSLPCVETGSLVDVEACHLSFASPKHGHYGRARGTKAPDRWALPLSAPSHRAQHSMNEAQFWQTVGVDPHLLALALFGLWSDLGDDAEPFAAAIINQGLARAGRLKDRTVA